MLAAKTFGKPDHAQSGGARGDLGIALRVLDQPLRPRLDGAGRDIPAMIEVTSRKVGVVGEHETNAVDALRGKSVVVRSPRSGVGYRGIPVAVTWHDGRLGS